MVNSRLVGFAFWGFCFTFILNNTILSAATLVEGTLVKIINPETIIAHDQDVGAPVNFVVAEDVTINNKIAIKKGTPVKAKVSAVTKESRFGMPGSLSINVVSTTTKDGRIVPLVGEVSMNKFDTEGAGTWAMKQACINSCTCGLGMFRKGGC